MIEFLVLFIFFVILYIHLYDCYYDYDRRFYTKPFLLPLILLYYLLSLEDIKYCSKPLVCALLFSALGDIILIKPGHVFFTMGGIAFMIAHFSFMYVYSINISFKDTNPYILIPFSLVYICISLNVIIANLPTTPKSMQVPMFGYLLINSCMNLYAFMRLMFIKNIAGIVAYIGSLLFFVSDCILFILEYHKRGKYLIYKRNFSVMITYALGELLIAQGVIMNQSKNKLYF